MNKNTTAQTSNQKIILIDATYPNETRLALSDNGELIEFGCQDNDHNELKGNIYLATIERIEPSLQAVFVNYGGEKLGFLPYNEIHPRYFHKQENEPATTEASESDRLINGLRRSQTLLVQISKGHRGTKGVMMTTYIVLSSRYIRLLIDNERKLIVSKKIEDQSERDRLEKIGKEMLKGQKNNLSLIFRSSSIHKTKKEILKDLSYLINLWLNISEHLDHATAPAFIHEEGDIALRSVRDLYNNDIDRIIVAGQRSFERVYSFVNALMPAHTATIELYTGAEPLFAKYSIERQVASLYNNKVDLPDGGYIVINQAEALVAIDVNSGKSSGSSNIADTAYRVNLQAVEVIAKQIMLRELSGIIVIDFIDMEQKSKRTLIEKQITKAFANDKAKTNISKISEFGLLEMTRQRIGHGAMNEVHRITCPSCKGRGRVRVVAASSNAILRAISSDIAKNPEIESIVVAGSANIVMHLLNEKRHEIVEIERKSQTKIEITIDEGGGYDCFFISHKKSVSAPVPLFNADKIIAEQHADNPALPTTTAASPRTSSSSAVASLPSNANNEPGRVGSRSARRRIRRRQVGTTSPITESPSPKSPRTSAAKHSGSTTIPSSAAVATTPLPAPNKPLNPSAAASHPSPKSGHKQAPRRHHPRSDQHRSSHPPAAVTNHINPAVTANNQPPTRSSEISKSRKKSSLLEKIWTKIVD